MNKEDCQIKIAQYTRGFSDGCVRSGKNPSGAHSNFYVEGYDDGDTPRSRVVDRAPSVFTALTPQSDLDLLLALRTALAKQDERLGASDVFRAVSEAGAKFMAEHLDSEAKRELASAVVDEIERRAAVRARAEEKIDTTSND